MNAVPSSHADKCGYLLYSGFPTCRKTSCSSFTMISDLTSCSGALGFLEVFQLFGSSKFLEQFGYILSK